MAVVGGSDAGPPVAGTAVAGAAVAGAAVDDNGNGTPGIGEPTRGGGDAAPVGDAGAAAWGDPGPGRTPEVLT